MLSIIGDLLSRKNLKVEVVKLFQAMAEHRGDDEVLDGDMKVLVYMNILSGNTKLVKYTIDVLEALGHDFWKETLELLCNHVKEDFDLDSFVKTLIATGSVEISVDVLSKLVVENSSLMSQHAAGLLMTYVKLFDDQKPKMLEILHDILEKCLDDEQTFIIILNTVNIVKNLSEFYKDHPLFFEALVTNLTTAYLNFELPLTLHNLVNALGELSQIAPEMTTLQVKSVYLKIYEKLLSVFEVSWVNLIYQIILGLNWSTLHSYIFNQGLLEPLNSELKPIHSSRS